LNGCHRLLEINIRGHVYILMVVMVHCNKTKSIPFSFQVNKLLAAWSLPVAEMPQFGLAADASW
jgi:hypothetical protein